VKERWWKGNKKKKKKKKKTLPTGKHNAESVEILAPIFIVFVFMSACRVLFASLNSSVRSRGSRTRSAAPSQAMSAPLVVAALFLFCHTGHAEVVNLYASDTIAQSNVVGVNMAQVSGPLVSWE
jgi:hypothetical protein